MQSLDEIQKMMNRRLSYAQIYGLYDKVNALGDQCQNLHEKLILQSQREIQEDEKKELAQLRVLVGKLQARVEVLEAR